MRNVGSAIARMRGPSSPWWTSEPFSIIHCARDSKNGNASERVQLLPMPQGDAHKNRRTNGSKNHSQRATSGEAVAQTR